MSIGTGNEIGIFWDFATAPAPPGQSGFAIANNIRLIAQEFGSIKAFKAYLSVTEHSRAHGSRASQFRSELQISGVSCTDIPDATRESALEQMLTVDLLLYALDKSPEYTRILIITENPAYAYAISTLRLRRYSTIVISSSHGHTALITQASLHFDWTETVLKSSGDKKSTTPHLAPKKMPVQSKSPVLGLNQTSTSAPKRSDEVDIEAFLQLHQKVPSHPQGSITPEELLSPRSRGVASFQPADVPFALADHAPSALSQASREWQTLSHLENDRSSTSSTPRRASMNGFSQKHSENATEASTSSIPTEPWRGITAVQSPSSISFLPLDAGVLGQRLERVTPPGVLSPQGPSVPLAPPISPPAARPHRPIQPTSKPVPPEFQPLVDVLRSHRAKGSFSALRSSVALELHTADKDVYKKAGTEKFAQYSSKAVDEGIVVMGGAMGNAWIQLHPDFC